MSIYRQPILVSLSDSNIFVILQTYDPQNGRSQRFCLSRKTLADQLDHTAKGVTIESDLQNFCSVALVDTDMTFVVYWLHGSGKIQGYQQSFSVPVSKKSRFYPADQSDTCIRRAAHPKPGWFSSLLPVKPLPGLPKTS